jgi:hypothetical protein
MMGLPFTGIKEVDFAVVTGPARVTGISGVDTRKYLRSIGCATIAPVS